MLRALGFSLWSGLVGRANYTIEGFGTMQHLPLLNKPDRAGSPHHDFSSGEDYKRWRDCSSHEKQAFRFQTRKHFLIFTWPILNKFRFKDPSLTQDDKFYQVARSQK